ncbi:MAG: ATP-binding protein [Candidatus Contendobacter sp.]|nr:ATP-binding protein [Candidatus Contendobacter sp.]MDG4555863.1 ATP-binding protein [Candidatus Contendobacter sp.]
MLLLIRIALVLVGLAAPSAASVGIPDSGVTIREALATVTIDGEAPSNPRKVRLPYRWDDFSGRRDGQARFEIRLDLLDNAPDGPRAIYLAKVGNQFEVRINGVLVSAPLDSQSPRLDLAKAPRLVTIPQALLRGDDRLEITIQAQFLRRGGLSMIDFGVESDLQREFNAVYQWRILGSLVVVSISVALGVFSLLLWSRQQVVLYWVFGIAELVWAFRVGDVLIEEPPLGWPAWGAAVAFAYALYVGFTARLTMLVLGVERGWFRLAWRAYLLGAAATSVIGFARGYVLLWTTWLGLMIGLATLCAGVAIRSAWLGRGLDQTLLAFSLTVSVLVGIRDWVYVWFTPDAFGETSWVRYMSVLFCLTMGFIIADRYTRAARELRALNQTLAERVAERERQLAASFERTREALQQAAVLAERQRLMRDMHDGLGSRLSGALGVLRRDDASSHSVAVEYLSEALEELKLAVDSLQDYGGDIDTVLGNLRYRLRDRLKAAGVNLIWRAQPLPPFEELTPTGVRSIQHLMLEAIANAMRHGAATEIVVTTRFDPEAGCAWIVIEDNGRGFDPDAVQGGRGLALIKQRARELGGEAVIGVGPGGGCQVQVRLPYGSAEPPECRPVQLSDKVTRSTGNEASP